MEKISSKKKGLFERFIDGVEVLGNKLPHPFWLFVSLMVIIIVLSFVLSKLDVSVTYLNASKTAGEVPIETTLKVQNLLSKDSLRLLFTNFTSIYSGFAPLSIVIIMMMSVGFLEKTGMLSALIRKTLMSTPEALIIAVIATVGVNANLASDAGVIIVPALAGAIFKSMGKNPWIGIIAGYAAANGGYSANFFVASMDAILAGITESVTGAVGIVAPVHPLMNWYFMVASTFVIIIGTVVVTKFFTEKRLGNQQINVGKEELKSNELTSDEKKGLKYCAIAAIIFIAVLLCMILPKNAIFRADDGSIIPKSPLMSSIISLLFLFFFTLAMAYGKGSGTIKDMKDVPKLMQDGVSSALGFIVIALPASLFIELFGMSNIATIIGVSIGELLKSINLGGFPLLLVFVLICTLMNLFMTSGTAKWLIIAPIFIPVMASLGFTPGLTQATYRIADTCTNITSPIDYYVPVIMGLLVTFNANKENKVGIGTVISLCLPYSIAFMIGLLILLFVWFTLGLPVGPGVPIFM